MNERQLAGNDYNTWLSQGERSREEKEAKKHELMVKYKLTSWVETSITPDEDELDLTAVAELRRKVRNGENGEK